jgi:hypothetical protein
LVFGIAEVKSVLLSRDWSGHYNSGEVCVLGHLDNSIRKAYSVNRGILNPKGFVGYLKNEYSGFYNNSPADLIAYIVSELNRDIGKRLFYSPFGKLFRINYTSDR